MTPGALSPEALGVVLAAMGALAWASHYLLIRVGLDGGELSDVVMIALLTNVVLVVPPSVALHYPDLGLTPRAVALFAAAGLASGLLGRVLQYQSTRTIGASRTSPITSSAGLVSTLLAVVVLGERLTTPHLAGILLIVVGVVVTSWETASDGGRVDSLREIGATMSLPILAATLYGVEPILIKVALAEGTPYLVGMSIMILSAAASYVVYRRLRGPVRLRSAVRGPKAKWYVAAALAGTAAFLAYFTALNAAPVVFVVPVFQTVPLLVAGLSLVFLPTRLERVTWRLGAAASLVVLGATLVSLAA